MAVSVLGIADDTALGCLMHVVVTRPSGLTAAKRAVDQVVDSMDAAASRFREDSELSRLNSRPEQDVVVSPLLAEAIAAAMRAAHLTGGAVDPTIGFAIKLAGYDTDFALVPADGSPIRVAATHVAGWRAIEFSPSSRLVRLPRGVELDLGATAKALASDMAALAASRAAGGAGALVSVGGDIAVAGECPPGGWQIQISEDSSAPIEEDEETVAITSGGLATSSTTVRRWTRGEQVLHHIVDPSTGLPTQGPWRTATVAAGSCVDANIAATAAIVLGRLAVSWLETHGLPARLVDGQGNVSRLPGWPARSEFAPKIF
jgi:thiamine biosynthesis lipoprotein